MVDSATMKRLWADPEWRERQLERKTEGQTRAAQEGRHSGRKLRNGYATGGQIRTSICFPHEVFYALKKIALRQNIPFAEIVRTYVEWGLEEEETHAKTDQ